MKKSPRESLKESFNSIPSAFAYREVKFHIYQALQKLETLEKREANRKAQQEQEAKLMEEKKRTLPWMPPIYQSPVVIKQTIDILDKMIESEKKIIENIHKKRQQNSIQDEDDDELQTFHG